MSKKIAVVTGASSGFGKLIAQDLVGAGYRTFGTIRDAHGRNTDAAKALEARGVEVVELDVLDQASVDRAAERILGDAGAVDVLVNNAGTAHNGLLEAFTPESFERQLATNVIGPHRVDRAFLPGMRERRSGLVIFISSVVGRFVLPFVGVYVSSKYALEGMAETLSYEVRPFGIDVAIVEPGAFATEILGKMIQPDDPQRVEAYGATAKLIEKFAEAVKDAGDPQLVSDALLDLVRRPAGARPLRTVLPAEMPVTQINNAVAPIQRSLIEMFGLGELLPKDREASTVA